MYIDVNSEENLNLVIIVNLYCIFWSISQQFLTHNYRKKYFR